MDSITAQLLLLQVNRLSTILETNLHSVLFRLFL
nr:MAG TPA: hypothetical protein [Bacteriophage sp.]